MGRCIDLGSYSFAAADAARHFAGKYLSESFPLSGKPYLSGLFDLGNGYFVRLLAQDDHADARKGAFFFAPYAMKRDGTLRPIRVVREKEGRYALFEDSSFGGSLFQRIEKDFEGYFDDKVRVSISFLRAVKIMERLARYEPSVGLGAPINDPEFSALRLSEMPWRKVVPYVRPHECRLFASPPVVETAQARDFMLAKFTRTLSLIAEQKKLG